MSDIVREFFEYLEYLEANGLKIDENGDVVPKEENGPKLVLGKPNDEE